MHKHTDKNKNRVKYLKFIIKKLRYLGLTIISLNVITIFSLNSLLLHLPFWFPLFVVFIPSISFFIFFLRNQIPGRFHNNMTHYKYNLIFPFIFHDDPAPKKSDSIDLDEIRKKIKHCDIILRRYNRYIDGLIFSENSYFTHVGIYCEDYKGISREVLHAEAEPGVHKTSLENFCNCDQLAILRFSLKKTEEEEQMHEHIKKEHYSIHDNNHIRHRELVVFNNLMKETKRLHGNFILKENDLFAEGYSNLILDRAISLLDTPYDFEFDFENFDHFSCIEYVWYCFKCLYPLHRIKVKDFEFFQLIKMPVIVPDVFVRNDFFRYVYTSLPIKNKDINEDEDEDEKEKEKKENQNKRALIKYTKSAQKQFWKFIVMILIWDVIFLFTLYLIFHSWLKIY